MAFRKRRLARRPERPMVQQLPKLLHRLQSLLPRPLAGIWELLGASNLVRMSWNMVDTSKQGQCTASERRLSFYVNSNDRKRNSPDHN